MMVALDDPVVLTKALIACESVTPHEGGALKLVQSWLEPLGFTCHWLTFAEAGTPTIDNLYARWGQGSPHFCFAGHTDVVPAGDASAWQSAPFVPIIRDEILYGRGASDMKSAIAAFICAAAARIQAGHQGSISLLLTGDEEGPSINGTKKMLSWCAEHGEIPDMCVVGEPTNPTHLGEMMKIGRRGSLNTTITAIGRQGHVAYPQRACNPVPVLLSLLQALDQSTLDAGNEAFQASHLEITTVDVGNPTTNLIPGKATARINIRFNNEHTGASLAAWLEKMATKHATSTVQVQLETTISGEAFLTPDGALRDIVSRAVASVTGMIPEQSTSGGTSDARFIKDYCPVVEFGGVGATMHQANESMAVADICQLAAIYQEMLRLAVSC